MQNYMNRAGSSGVVAYEYDDVSIFVEFKGGKKYEYNHSAPGANHVEAMKKLADDGAGLATYISQNVKSNFARKL